MNALILRETTTKIRKGFTDNINISYFLDYFKVTAMCFVSLRTKGVLFYPVFTRGGRRICFTKLSLAYAKENTK